MTSIATIHELYVWKLAKELRKEYDQVFTNVPLSTKKRGLAEIDILAKKDGETFVFEVKTSLRLTKARKQFRKIRKHLPMDIAGYYLYIGDADRLLEVQI